MEVKEQFSQLYNLLQRQKQIVEQLISIAEEQTLCLRRNDAQSLQQFTEKQALLSGTLATMEKDRIQVQESLERELGLPRESSLKDLVPYAPEKTALELNNIKASLKKNTERLKEINSLNQALAGRALQFTNFMLDLLQPKTEVGYTKDGSLNKTPKSISRLNKSV